MAAVGSVGFVDHLQIIASPDLALLKKLYDCKNPHAAREIVAVALSHMVHMDLPCDKYWVYPFFREQIWEKVDLTLMQLDEASWDHFRTLSEKLKGIGFHYALTPDQFVPSNAPPEYAKMFERIRLPTAAELKAELKIQVRVGKATHEFARNRLALLSDNMRLMLARNTGASLEIPCSELKEEDHEGLISFLERSYVKLTDDNVLRFLKLARNYQMPLLIHLSANYCLTHAAEQKTQKERSEMWVKGLQALGKLSEETIKKYVIKDKQRHEHELTELKLLAQAKSREIQDELQQHIVEMYLKPEIAALALLLKGGIFTISSISEEGVVKIALNGEWAFMGAMVSNLPTFSFPFPFALDESAFVLLKYIPDMFPEVVEIEFKNKISLEHSLELVQKLPQLKRYWNEGTVAALKDILKNRDLSAHEKRLFGLCFAGIPMEEWEPVKELPESLYKE